MSRAPFLIIGCRCHGGDEVILKVCLCQWNKKCRTRDVYASGVPASAVAGTGVGGVGDGGPLNYL